MYYYRYVQFMQYVDRRARIFKDIVFIPIFLEIICAIC